MEPPVLSIDRYRHNGELIAAVARLGYLRPEHHVLDPTHGKGVWWRTWQPNKLTAHDIDPAKAPDGPADFTALPYPDDHFDAVAFDPPYKLCLDAETEVLTRRGWLRHDQVEVGDVAYSLNHDTGEGEWRRITAVNRYDRSPTEVRVCEGKNLDFVATPDHRWPVLSEKGRRRWKVTDALRNGDRVIHAARWSGIPVEVTHDDSFVELVAWFWTEGHVKEGTTYGTITQSFVVNPGNCDRIAACLEKLYGPAVDHFPRAGRTSEPMWRTFDDEGRNRRFIFSAAVGLDLLAVAPLGTSTVRPRGGPTPTLEFLEALTVEQLELFITTSLEADGSSDERLGQRDECMADAFAMACLLSGRAVSQRWLGGTGHAVTIKRSPHSKPSRPGVASEVRDVAVWCPTVEGTGTWLARRNGTVYFTGNSGRPALGQFDHNYGVQVYTRWQDRMDLCRRGIVECARVLRPGGVLLVKSQDQVVSGAIRFQSLDFANVAVAVGCTLVDQLHYLSYRQQPLTRPCGRCDGLGVLGDLGRCGACDGAGEVATRQIHSRRNYSTLQVFRKVVTP